MINAPHAMSRYAAVTERLIEKCQQDYYANRDLGQSVPSLSAAEVSVVIVESLEADSVIHRSRETLLRHARDGSLSDWSLAVVAEMLFSWTADVDANQDIFASSRRDEYLDLAWTALEHTLSSPTASPMLWYEQIYFEVAQQYRLKKDVRTIELMKQGLAHDLDFHGAKNALNFLRDLADSYLALGQLDTGLGIFTRLLQFRPAEIWTYNAIALTFDRYGLTDVGTQATRRGIDLLEQIDAPPELLRQLTNSLEDMRRADRHGCEAEVSPQILADFKQALALDFETRQPYSIDQLCEELIPDLREVPRKIPKSLAMLPPPPGRLAQTVPGRNEPCWCGSGRKYKHCHLKADMKLI
jgi:hypothetical protein